MDHLNIWKCLTLLWITKSSIITLNGDSIEKLIGDFSMKTCIELIDVRVLNNNDHRNWVAEPLTLRSMLLPNVWYQAAMVWTVPVQFNSVTQLCLTLRHHGLQHARPPCPSPTAGVYSNSCPLSQWCHPTILNHLVLCCPLLLLTSIFSNIRVFSSESVLCIRWPKY